jgi:hypothetical protein
VLLGERAELQPGGWARDRVYPGVYYVPPDARFDLRTQRIEWKNADGSAHTLKLLPGITYVLPSGYKVEMVKPEESNRWGLCGTTAEGLLRHKPCTVSGGGKCEISKAISEAMFTGPVFVNDLARDLDAVEAILARDYHDRLKNLAAAKSHARTILSPERSLGSVVKLLSPSTDYKDEYNAWLATIPRSVRDLVLLLKLLYKPEWGAVWRKQFTVDTINARPGNELKYHDERLPTHYLGVGYTREGGWRTFTVRSDFFLAEKIQAEDDITASIVAPTNQVPCLPSWVTEPSVKFVHNCELRLFQRPDDAIVRGYAKRTERDFSRPENFFSNYEALKRDAARAIVDDTIAFEKFTEPMQRSFREIVPRTHPTSSFHRPTRASSRANPRKIRAISKSVWISKTPADRRAAVSPHRFRSAGAVSGWLRAARPPPESARARCAPALRIQSDPLPGTTRGLDGSDREPHGQIAVDHRCRL